MVNANWRLAALTAILLLIGTSSAILNSIVLLIVGLAGLFVLIGFSSTFRYMESLGVFSLSPLICIPYNIGLSIRIAIAYYEEIPHIAPLIALGIMCAIIMTCLEEILLGFLSIIIWREQDELACKR